MDLEDQWAIKKAIQDYGAENLIVILGCPDAQCAELHGETVTTGDPSLTGPLAGVPLGLPVYHILEEEIKNLIPEDVYRIHLQTIELSLDGEAISQRLKDVRARSKKE